MKRKGRKYLIILRRILQAIQLIFSQETYTTSKIEKLYKYQWHGNMIFSDGRSNSRGVIVAFRHGHEYKMLSDPICDTSRRYIILNMEIQGSLYIFVMLL